MEEFFKERFTKMMMDGIKKQQKRTSPYSTISESKISANKELTEKEKEILIIHNIFKNKLPKDIINHINEFYSYTVKHIKAVRIIQRSFKKSNKYKEFRFKDDHEILGPMFALFVLDYLK